MMTWALDSVGDSVIEHAGRTWILSVEFTGVGNERRYWLSEGDVITEIKTIGGLYTALDIASAYIEKVSLTAVLTTDA
jgi:hypothetical protein